MASINDLNIKELEDKYLKGSIQERENALISFLTLIGIDENTSKDFIDNNYSSFTLELSHYGFSLNNPFIKFLMDIQQKKPSLLSYLKEKDN